MTNPHLRENTSIQISDLFRFIFVSISEYFKIIQRNIDTNKLNNTIRDEDAIKNTGPKNW